MSDAITVPCQYKTGITLSAGAYAVVKGYLVTEYAYGGELFDHIVSKGSYPEYDVVNLVRNITDAVAYLHDNGIVHRNLKSENILFRTHDENYDIIIIGFHFSRIIDDSEVLTIIHGSTPYYIAPEIFKKSGYGKPVDLWAIGVITYFLLCGYTPFYRENSKEELTAIIQSEHSFDIKFWDGISDLAKDFINQLLIANPNERITAHQALAHPWFSEMLAGSTEENFNAHKETVDSVKTEADKDADNLK